MNYHLVSEFCTWISIHRYHFQKTGFLQICLNQLSFVPLHQECFLNRTKVEDSIMNKN